LYAHVGPVEEVAVQVHDHPVSNTISVSDTTSAQTPTIERRPFGLAAAITGLLGSEIPIAIDCYDGSRLGPPDSATHLVVRSPKALRYILTAPGEIGFARAYVAGEIEVHGDIFEALALRDNLPDVKVTPRDWLALARTVGVDGLRPLPPPPEEVRVHGRRHTKERDAAVIAHHYDVSNDFYRIVLGSSMTYSCAVFPTADTTLEAAQAAKYELVCRKLGLRPGMRLLDVGCGWGGMVMHAARAHGVNAVGVTLSARQAEWARNAVREAGLEDRVEIRVQDYRDVCDGPFDAVSSIGMFEHVGGARLDEYFTRLYSLLRPEGRLLNHGIGKRPGSKAAFSHRGFIDRYVFPDGELHEVGSVVTRVQRAGFEVRNVEGLREHYAQTLRHWVANLEGNWDEAVRLVGAGRARVWRLYMAASAINFDAERAHIHQVLAVRNEPDGTSAMPRRPDWEVPA
jgi:cyclopropane-fatty-acyl-phospholipid synthase